MANIDRPIVRIHNNATDPWIVRCYIDGNVATAVGKGSLVKIMTDGSTSVDMPSVDVMTADSADYYGVVVGIYDTDKKPVTYLAASTVGYVDVATNPNLKLIIQGDGAGTAWTQAAIGDSPATVYGGVNTSTGNDKIELNEDSLAGNGSQNQFLLLDLLSTPDNSWAANADVVVIAAQHYLKAAIAAV